LNAKRDVNVKTDFEIIGVRKNATAFFKTGLLSGFYIISLLVFIIFDLDIVNRRDSLECSTQFLHIIVYFVAKWGLFPHCEVETTDAESIARFYW